MKPGNRSKEGLELNPNAQRLVVKKERTGIKLPDEAVLDGNSAAKLALDMIGDNAYEVFLAFYLNSRNKLIGFDSFTTGSIGSVGVDPAGIARDALLVGAVGVLTAHQHPSGEHSASHDDVRLWGRLREILSSMGIQLLDNLIITERGYLSEVDGSGAVTPWRLVGGVAVDGEGLVIRRAK